MLATTTVGKSCFICKGRVWNLQINLAHPWKKSWELIGNGNKRKGRMQAKVVQSVKTSMERNQKKKWLHKPLVLCTVLIFKPKRCKTKLIIGPLFKIFKKLHILCKFFWLHVWHQATMYPFPLLLLIIMFKVSYLLTTSYTTSRKMRVKSSFNLQIILIIQSGIFKITSLTF